MKWKGKGKGKGKGRINLKKIGKRKGRRGMKG